MVPLTTLLLPTFSHKIVNGFFCCSQILLLKFLYCINFIIYLGGWQYNNNYYNNYPSYNMNYYHEMNNHANYYNHHSPPSNNIYKTCYKSYSSCYYQSTSNNNNNISYPRPYSYPGMIHIVIILSIVMH